VGVGVAGARAATGDAAGAGALTAAPPEAVLATVPGIGVGVEVGDDDAREDDLAVVTGSLSQEKRSLFGRL
jgi:hypothetical protein